MARHRMSFLFEAETFFVATETQSEPQASMECLYLLNRYDGGRSALAINGLPFLLV